MFLIYSELFSTDEDRLNESLNISVGIFVFITLTDYNKIPSLVVLAQEVLHSYAALQGK